MKVGILNEIIKYKIQKYLTSYATKEMTGHDLVSGVVAMQCVIWLSCILFVWQPIITAIRTRTTINITCREY